jgi:hypothetical protein
MQGIGVSVPIAAAVADATVGLARLLQTPKGRMLSIGTWSMMLAATLLLVMIGLNVGIRALGAAPMLHFIWEPMQH